MVGGIMAAELGDRGGIGRGYAYIVLILICIYVAGFSWSWGPLGWLVPGEIFPLEIRSAGKVLRMGCSDDCLRALLAARDEEGAN
ncbi:hypothetical protein RCOM_1500990 [Ricinus communis]|uniref:Sugar transporter n=1 Tax=Ricinus communis TaxID=3988 RepID=B9R9W5_RICCO|nr:hypothetical protein RCOM_1500990 [Ricinus communis]